MKKLALLAVATLAISSLSGCQLCLLPCYICALGSGQQVAVQENKELPLPEVAPNFISKSLLVDRGAPTTH
ncbi:MAG: hypothetical protein Q8O67_34290 [Deltaproteobacteria bacterium]|nr:hypothetical protein [Deltaproteobacteria bacterium]